MKRQITIFAKRVLPQEIRFPLRKLNWKFQYFVQSNFGKTNPAGVVDPLSGNRYKKFIALNGHLLSPDNGARNRQRLVWLYLQNETTIFKSPTKLLHVAPELPYMELFKKQPNLTYVPGDKMVEGYDNQSGILNIDLTALSFPDNEFDYIVCNHVLEHIPNDRLAMSEMYRVLKKGGTAIITIPIKESLKQTLEDEKITTPEDREKFYGQWDHVRFYSLDVKDRLESVGFSVDMNRYADKFSKEDYEKYGLCKDIIIVAKKN